MTTELSSERRWLDVGTIEVAEYIPLASHLNEHANDFRLVRTVSPPGYAWLDVHVDCTQGVQQAMSVARSIMAELAASNLTGFRIVAGARFLDTDVEESNMPSLAGR